MKVKTLQDKLDQLYKGVDPTDRKHDDEKILRGERIGYATKQKHKDPNWKKNWHQKNTDRFQDPAYRKKISNSLKKSDAVKNRSRTQKSNPKWVKSHTAGIKRYVSDPNYVNPRGMLGKKHKKETLEQLSDSQSKVKHTKEWNANISMARKNHNFLTDQSKKKISKALSGRPTGRTVVVKTPKGTFDGYFRAAEAYGVTPGAIKLWCKTKPKQFKVLKNNHGAKKIKTPKGIFKNVSVASESYGISPQALRARIRTKPNEYYYIIKSQ